MTGRTIGAIGLGLLGSALTATLLDRGYAVPGFDEDPERLAEHERRGGVVAGSAADVAARADRILLVLPASEIAAEVCRNGIAPVARSGTVVMDMTTVRPSDSVATHDALAAAGIAYLGSSVSGSSAMAWRQDIVLMVGGPADAVQRVRPVLEALGRSIHHVGGPGTGPGRS